MKQAVKASIAFLPFIFAIGCMNEVGEEESEEDIAEVDARGENTAEAYAEMMNVDGDQVGLVTFTEENGAVMIEAEATGLTPGYHGFHIHEHGICEPVNDEPFDSAGGHYNPEDEVHADHAGDMPSLYGKEDGSAYLKTSLDRFHPGQLLEDEVAVIIHEEADNFAHIPERYQSTESDEPGPDEETLRTGDSGERYACGEVVGTQE
ncbi:superoxide dismutase family protein [Salsuginibacillus kocurii]|uniref:superoxide dismutase family protein n=1 Tax=Salsuginibacillus kocurii TaxID=427078 RepID=UPI00036CD2C7|nr:superoxide dismutase family protein [Salsuginibacillus kocurii]